MNARFYMKGKKVMFTASAGPGNIVGPRLAVDGDAKKHSRAWTSFCGESKKIKAGTMPSDMNKKPKEAD